MGECLHALEAGRVLEGVGALRGRVPAGRSLEQSERRGKKGLRKIKDPAHSSLGSGEAIGGTDCHSAGPGGSGGRRLEEQGSRARPLRLRRVWLGPQETRRAPRLSPASTRRPPFLWTARFLQAPGGGISGPSPSSPPYPARANRPGPPALTAPAAPAAPPLPGALPHPLRTETARSDTSRARPNGWEHVGPLRPEPEAAASPAP